MITFEDVLWFMRAYYLSQAFGMLFAAMLPAFRSLARYGKTLESPIAKSDATSATHGLMVSKKRMRDYYIFASFYCCYLLYELILRNVFHDTGFLFRWFQVYISSPSSAFIAKNGVDALLATFLMQIQVARRLWDCVMVDRPSPKSKMPLISHYILGILYYVFSCVAVWIDASPNLGIWTSSTISMDWKSLANHVQWHHVIAIVLFIWASYHQHRAHVILASLRSPGSTEYKIPNGDWFEYVSSPHYTAEIIIYLCMWWISGFSITLGCDLVLVVVNLSISAVDGLSWYRQKFGEKWPQNRKAIIPGVL